MGELAAVLACDASNATWLVDRLEERGLVERRPYPGDRRVKAVVLTEEGAKLRALLTERLATPPEDLVALDREDLEALHAALERLPHHPPFWAPTETTPARDCSTGPVGARPAPQASRRRRVSGWRSSSDRSRRMRLSRGATAPSTR